MEPYSYNSFGANFDSNTYSDGKGIIKFAGDVTRIGDNAFYCCKGLTSITIPNSVTSIGYGAFNSCEGLTSITIPNSVMRIESEAFDFCTSLTSVKVEATTPPKAGDSMFLGCSKLTDIFVPSASVDAYKTASGWSDYADIIDGFQN